MEEILCLQALVSLLICMRDSHFRMPMVHEFYKIFQGSFGFWSHVLSLVQGMDEYTYDTETGPRNVHKRGHIIPSGLGLDTVDRSLRLHPEVAFFNFISHNENIHNP